jgi:uncharacterized membrane protein YGL010W
MSKLEGYFADYSQYHRTLGNQRTHLFGIPMIVVAVLAWASRWVWVRWHSPELPMSLVQMDLACLIILLVSAWYCVLSWRVGLPALVFLYGAYWIGRAISNEVATVLFVGGWILQLIGHAIYEKKSPAFTKNVEHLLIGPLWVFVKVFRL